MNDEILIRPVRHDDFAKWKVLGDGYNAFYGRKGNTAMPETNHEHDRTDLPRLTEIYGHYVIHAPITSDAKARRYPPIRLCFLVRLRTSTLGPSRPASRCADHALQHCNEGT